MERTLEQMVDKAVEEEQQARESEANWERHCADLRMGRVFLHDLPYDMNDDEIYGERENDLEA